MRSTTASFIPPAPTLPLSRCRCQSEVLGSTKGDNGDEGEAEEDNSEGKEEKARDDSNGNKGRIEEGNKEEEGRAEEEEDGDQPGNDNEQEGVQGTKGDDKDKEDEDEDEDEEDNHLIVNGENTCTCNEESSGKDFNEAENYNAGTNCSEEGDESDDEGDNTNEEAESMKWGREGKTTPMTTREAMTREGTMKQGNPTTMSEET